MNDMINKFYLKQITFAGNQENVEHNKSDRDRGEECRVLWLIAIGYQSLGQIIKQLQSA